MKVGGRVLNVGCVTGGASIFLARHYGVYVHGIDISGNMIHLAIERQGSLPEPRVKRMVDYFQRLCFSCLNLESAFNGTRCNEDFWLLFSVIFFSDPIWNVWFDPRRFGTGFIWCNIL